MLSSIIIGGDPDLVRYLRQVSADFADVWIYKVLGETARRYEIVAALNSYVPDVVFLDISNLGSADSVAALCLEEILPQRSGTAVVPFASRGSMPVEVSDPKLALGAILTPPFNADHLERAIREAMHRIRPTTHESHVLAVLPAKPGSGATTVALHLAATAASRYEQKTLLIEADSHSGALTYMLGLEPACVVGEALRTRLDTEQQWSGVVTRSHGIDILPASAAPEAIRASRWDLSRLVNLAREHYDTIIVDLPSVVDEVSEAILGDADKGILVSTPALPALHMVRRRLFELERHGVRHGHLQLLVNRATATDPNTAEIIDLTRHPVNARLPEDGAALTAATRRMGLADVKSRFRRELLPLTGTLLGVEPIVAEESALQVLRNFIGSAFGIDPNGAFLPSAHRPLEAKREFYHSGGRRQLDRR
jgi:Mrp family chromosome partitioning ATPase